MTWVEIRCDLYRCETQILGSRRRRDGTWIEVRRTSGDLEGGEMLLSWPGWRWDAASMEGIRAYWDLYAFESSSGWRWDTTWMEVSRKWRPRGGWDAALMTWMQVRRSINGWDTCILGPLCIWIKFWMEVRHNLDGGESQMKLKRWMKWEGTWIEERRDSWDLNGGETWHRRRWEWDVPGTRMQVRWYMDGGEHKSSVLGEVRWDLDGAEMQFSGPGSGPGWSRDVTWMEMWHEYWDLGGDKMWPGWRRDTNLGTCMELDGTWMQVRCNPGNLKGEETWQRGEMKILVPACRWDVTWMQVRCKFWDMDGSEMGPWWKWDTNLGTWMGWDGTWMKLRCNLRNVDGGEMWPEWWDTNIETWLEMKHEYLDGSDVQLSWPGWESRCDLDGDETWILGLR